MNNSDKKLVYLLIALPVVVLAFFSGLYVGEGDSSVNPETPSGSTVSDEQMETFWKAWEVLEKKHVNAASTTPQDMVWGSIQGLASSYGDPYTVFFPPRENKIFKEDIAGNFGGVGMEIGVRDGRLVVIAPLKGNPAEKAGVKAGEAIVSINGASSVSMNTDEAVSLIRGPRGTKVVIEFMSSDGFIEERTITRDTINIPTIDTSIESGGIFVIKLYNFSANSADLFRSALREFVLSGNNKMILDLRRNPGGYLEAAWDMASFFLPAGKVIVTEDFAQNGKPVVYRSKGYDIFDDNLEMLILVDGGSASASEILAGALRENGVAELVGSKTFGKGSVQELVPITTDTSIKVTIARWLTPNGHNLSQDGLTPDHVVDADEGDTKAGDDPVMDKALELLRAVR